MPNWTRKNQQRYFKTSS